MMCRSSYENVIKQKSALSAERLKMPATASFQKINRE